MTRIQSTYVGLYIYTFIFFLLNSVHYIGTWKTKLSPGRWSSSRSWNRALVPSVTPPRWSAHQAPCRCAASASALGPMITFLNMYLGLRARDGTSYKIWILFYLQGPVKQFPAISGYRYIECTYLERVHSTRNHNHHYPTLSLQLLIIHLLTYIVEFPNEVCRTYICN
jgi:hypothetical protein